MRAQSKPHSASIPAMVRGRVTGRVTYNPPVDPIDGTRWCPRDTAINKTWRYCVDCEPRRKAGRCPYMWLYWQKKSEGESEASALETYERICDKCGNRLSFHHALIHLLNARGYREMKVAFDHKRAVAHFESCPYCFSGVGWFPGKPPPEVEIPDEEKSKSEQKERIARLLGTPKEDAETRSRKIAGSLARRPDVDVGLFEYIEYEGADMTPAELRARREAAYDKRLADAARLERPEIVYPREFDLPGEASDGGEDAPEIASEPEGIEFRFHELEAPAVADDENRDADALEFDWEDEPEPRIEGVPRCPNHDYRNADRECPLCHRRMCRKCMALVKGVYACRDCFDSYLIRNAYEIPKDWAKHPQVDLRPTPVRAGARRYGLVRIDYEGVPARPGHRLLAHIVDAALAAAVAGLLQLAFLHPLRGLAQSFGNAVDWIARRSGNLDFAGLDPGEALAKLCGLGGLLERGFTPQAIWWLVGLPAIAWIFIGLAPVFSGRSAGQRACNIAPVDDSGRSPDLRPRIARALFAVLGIASAGVLALVSYVWGPGEAYGLADRLTGTRVVTYRGDNAYPPAGDFMVRIAAAGATNKTGEEIP
ncbi:MAG: RDD family protein [bacterium]|jgi:uncharacterized RDD family membrane protein YckC